MRTIFAEQYGTACIQIHEGDDVDEVIEQAEIEGALYEEEPGEDCYVVEFPGRFPELYTKNALMRSMKRKAAPAITTPMTVGEIAKQSNEDEAVYFFHKLHGKIMPEEIMIPVTAIKHKSEGLILS